MDSPDHKAIDHAADLIEQADALIVAAGAGMGVDSGLPDFRGTDGFWKAYPALSTRKMPFHQVASPATFSRDPALAWGFYGHRLALYRSTLPHAGFELLKRWGEATLHGYAVFTSNVDGQFQRAGFSGCPLVECHGSLHWLQCSQPCWSGKWPLTWPAEGFAPVVDHAQCMLVNDPPRCPDCGAIARPNVLMFSDDGWIEERTARQEAAMESWLRRVERPVVVELGAGTAIPSVRYFTQRVLCDHGGRLVRINPREAGVPTSADVGLPVGALAGLQAISAARGGCLSQSTT
jgi:NAD-dependent SIR2 family protein deacetylase